MNDYAREISCVRTNPVGMWLCSPSFFLLLPGERIQQGVCQYEEGGQNPLQEARPIFHGTVIAVFTKMERRIESREVRIMQKGKAGRYGFLHSHSDRNELERWLRRAPVRENTALGFVIAGSLALLGLFLYSLLQGM